MKIRCKNCYKVLNPNEEYCTYCGEHSEQIAKAMRTGDYGGGAEQKLKISFLVFVLIAFLGTGIISVVLAAIQGTAYNDIYKKANALLITSVVTLIVMVIINYKEFKDYFWNGNLKQFLGCSVIGILTIIIVCSLSLISRYTTIYPTEYVTYFTSGKARWFSGGQTNIFLTVLTYSMIAFVEELLFRRMFIDALDENTMLSDPAIILIGGIVGTALDFAWIMSPEVLVCSFIINLVMTGIYANSNRSVILNVVLRIAIIIAGILILL